MNAKKKRVRFPLLGTAAIIILLVVSYASSRFGTRRDRPSQLVSSLLEKAIQDRRLPLQNVRIENASIQDRSSLTDEVRDHVLDSVLRLQDGLDLSSSERDQLVNELGQYGDRILSTIYEELNQDNQFREKLTVERRLRLIDALGHAAQTQSVALRLLRDYCSKPLEQNKDKRLLHMDLFDRLESFEYLAAWDREDAIVQIHQIQNASLRKLYINHFAIGLKIAGMDEEAALSTTAEIFKEYAHA